MGHTEDIENLKKEMAQCRNNVYDEINDIKVALASQSQERQSFNTAITQKIDSVINRFNSHDEEEMKKYDQIIDKLSSLVDAIGDLTTKTDDNVEFIVTVKKYWGRISFGVTMIVSTLAALYWLYSFLQKHGLVIVFEKAAG